MRVLSEKAKLRSIEYGKWYRLTEHGKLIRQQAYENTPDSWRIFYRAKRRAKEAGLEFDIEKSDVIIPDSCPVTGLKLKVSRGNKGFKDNSPSLDRIDCSKGYIKNNVAVISMRANKTKCNLSLKEIEKLYEYAILRKGIING